MTHRTTVSIAAVCTLAIAVPRLPAQTTIPAHGEITEAASQRVGFFEDTWAPSDGRVESLTEDLTDARPNKRTSLLIHAWQFTVPAATSITLHVRAARDVGAEDFAFAASIDQGQSFQPLPAAVVDQAAMTLYSAALPSIPTAGGLVLIRVEDTDRSSRETTLDTVHVDYLALEVEVWQPGPPDAPTMVEAGGKSPSTILVGWTDAASDEDGYRVERSVPGANAWVVAGSVEADERLFTDAWLPAATSYDYRVIAFNALGDSTPSDTASAATRPEGSYAAELVPQSSGTFRLVLVEHATTPTGQVLVGRGSRDGVHLSTRDPVYGSWTSELVDSAPVSSGGDFEVAPDGTPTFAYLEDVPGFNTPDDVRFAERRYGSWQVTTIDREASDAPLFAFDPSDPQGQDIAIGYRKLRYKFYRPSRDFEPGIHVARRVGGQWSIDIIETDVPAASSPTVAFAPTGELLVAYFRVYWQGSTHHVDVVLARHDGSGWLAPEVVGEHLSSSSQYTLRRGGLRLAVDPISGRAAIAYAIGSEPPELWVVRDDGTAWTSDLITTANPDAFAIGATGEPLVGYTRDGGVHFARWNGAVWTEQSVDPLGRDLRIDVDGQGGLSFVYSGVVTWLQPTGLLFARRP